MKNINTNYIKKKSNLMLHSKHILLSILLLLVVENGFSQSSSIEKLKEDNLVDISLYFYPSTLRMVNIEHNEEFNQLIKGLKKLIFFKLDKSKFDAKQFYEVINKLGIDQNLEEYVVVDGNKQKLYILGSDSPAETAIMAYYNGDYYALDVVGSINLAELPTLYNQLSSGDEALNKDFENIFGLIKSLTQNNSRKGNVRIDD